MTDPRYLPPLPAHLDRRGTNPDVIGQELLDAIKHAIANQPRTLQRRIGPSEIGHPCSRRIGYKLLGAPDLNPNQGVAWKPFIGTAMHHELETVFDQFNLAYDAANGHLGHERFLIESKVTCGSINGEEIDGHTDVYDRATATVIDWKLVGPDPLRKYRRNGPGSQYRTQGHAYGRGWRLKGLPVDHVMIVFLPRNDELHKTYIWHEPYDERVAIAGFDRAQGIATMTAQMGVQALLLLPTADAYCYRCPFYKSGSIDLVQGCPGDPAAQEFGGQPALTFAGDAP